MSFLLSLVQHKTARTNDILWFSQAILPLNAPLHEIPTLWSQHSGIFTIDTKQIVSVVDERSHVNPSSAEFESVVISVATFIPKQSPSLDSLTSPAFPLIEMYSFLAQAKKKKKKQPLVLQLLQNF